MPIPTVCPDCGGEVRITRNGVAGPDSETSVQCRDCSFLSVYE